MCSFKMRSYVSNNHVEDLGNILLWKDRIKNRLISCWDVFHNNYSFFTGAFFLFTRALETTFKPSLVLFYC